MNVKFAFALALAAASATAQARLEMSGIFTDNMVLQRGKPIPVWGKATPGTMVKVVFDGDSAEAMAGARGDWEVKLPAREADAVGKKLVLTGDGATVVCTNVLVGDVWLCSGQSNSEMTFNWGILDGKEVMAASTNYPCIRVTKVGHVTSPYPVKYQTDSYPWVVANPETLKNVTAMGYFFARDINRRTGIPIGIIDDNWSGCRIEPFICAEGLASEKDLRHELVYALRYTNWVEQVTAGGPLDYRMPPECGFGTQHNAMIEPLVRFPITGALWYQGCSNGNEGMTYATKLRALIAGWRAKWNCGDFPFYIVQLASFTAATDDPAGGNGYAKIRNAMRIVAQTVPNTGLAVAIDIGNARDIHPKNKHDVGVRLARWARRDVYGEKDLVVSGPLYKSMKVEDGKIRISFDHVGSGLMAAEKGPDTPGVEPTPCALGEDALKGFAIAGEDHVWQWADAEIDGKDVVVSSPAVTAPVAVRYAHRANPMGNCNLYNKEGLPASPFRTDDWEDAKKK